ncbi:HAD hydrolase-like protein (plasmid) [Rhizobium leguminosarum]
MLEEKTAILFDMDGTLLDSKDEVFQCIRATILELGHRFDPSQDLTFCLGPPISETMPKVLEHYSDTRTDAAIGMFYKHQRAAGGSSSQLFPGIVEMLSSIRKTRRSMFVATSKLQTNTGDILDSLGISCFFEAVYGAVQGSRQSKSEIIGHVLDSHKLRPGNVLMIGDRSFDMAGAVLNGVSAAGALWGYGSEAELTSSGATLLFETPADAARQFADHSFDRDTGA